MQHQFSNNGIQYTVTDDGGELKFDPQLPEGEAGRNFYKFVDMMISRKFPGMKTEATRFAGVGTLDKQFKDDPEYLKGLTENVQKLGFKPKPTDIYCEQLVRPGFKTGDPEAFVPAADPTGHIKRVISKRIDYERKREEKLREQKMAPDVYKRIEKEYIAKDSNFEKLPEGERRDVIISKHAHKE